MKYDLKWIGYAHALYRTLWMSLVILFFASMTREFWYNGLGFVMLYVIIISVLSAAIIYTWIVALLGGPLRGIQKFCDKSSNPKAMMARIEKVWDEGFATQHCRIDDEYFVFARKMRGVVVPLENIISIQYIFDTHGSLDTFFIYLNNRTFIRLFIRNREGTTIIEHLKQNLAGLNIDIAVQLQKEAGNVFKNVIGRVNARYRLVEIQGRYFIVDYASPAKLHSYPIFATIYRLLMSSSQQREWRAWEVSKDELQSIKYKPNNTAYKIWRFDVTTIGFVFLFIFYVVSGTELPLPYVMQTQPWRLILFPIGLFLVYFLGMLMTSRIRKDKFTEVIIISQNNEFFDLRHLLLNLALHVAAMIFLIATLVGMAFVWNVPLIVYACWIYFWTVYTLFYFTYGSPNIDPQSTIQKNPGAW